MCQAVSYVLTKEMRNGEGKEFLPLNSTVQEGYQIK